MQIQPTHNLKDALRRPNETIGLVPGPGEKITLVKRIIYHALLHEVAKQGDKDRYEFLQADLARKTGINESNGAYLRAQLDGLRNMTFRLSVSKEVDGETEIEEMTLGYIDKPGSISRRGTNTRLFFSIDPVLKERILNPLNKYTILPLEIISRFKTTAGVALAEICYMYRTNFAGKGYGVTGSKPLEWWLPRLLGHLPKVGYEFKYFNRDVLTPALAEVNKNTPFKVAVIIGKVGRVVTTLEFHIHPKPLNLEILEDVVEGVTVEELAAKRGVPVECFYLIKKIKEAFGGSEADAIAIIRSLPEPLPLEEQIQLHQEQIASGWRLQAAPIASFKSRVKERWGAGKSSTSFGRSTPTHQSQAAPPSDAGDSGVKELNAKIAAAYEKYNTLIPESQQEVIDQFLKDTNDYVREMYKKSGFKSQPVVGTFKTWLVDEDHAAELNAI
jgi:hypothetical protein